ncbi:putative quinol monooxygenase [Maridesulfovibrio bastinii]|uniref:putative quinol monooxygenase n=1 Tax=Maridesulfovibrio bastinii TaxID=47157 RepID=UPI00041AFF32|nr:putative quinol monooxygenase [Maridesulfovibrio bastinii]
MVIVNAIIKPSQGNEKKVEKILRSLIPKVEKEERTLIYDLYRSKSEPCTFFFYECYPDQQALDSHSAQPYLQELGGRLEGLLREDNFVEVFELLDRIQK